MNNILIVSGIAGLLLATLIAVMKSDKVSKAVLGVVMFAPPLFLAAYLLAAILGIVR